MSFAPYFSRETLRGGLNTAAYKSWPTRETARLFYDGIRPARHPAESIELEAVESLFGAGAIATLPHDPQHILVGDIRWLDEAGLLLFTAFGDGPTDSRLLLFDDTIVNSSGSITFMRGREVAGSLHPIEAADVEDPADYRIAWQLWQEVAPLHRPLIERCFDLAQQEYLSSV